MHGCLCLCTCLSDLHMYLLGVCSLSTPEKRLGDKVSFRRRLWRDYDIIN